MKGVARKCHGRTLSFLQAGARAGFDSEGSEKGSRFRLGYLAGNKGRITVDFLVTPLGGEFNSYVRGEIKTTG
jgi:hypothetical protein